MTTDHHPDPGLSIETTPGPAGQGSSAPPSWAGAAAAALNGGREPDGRPYATVVFGDQIGDGTIVLEDCRGPRVCQVKASTHSPGGSGFVPDRAWHRLTVLRHRAPTGGGSWIPAVVADPEGAEQPWQTYANTPLRVIASTLPASEPAPEGSDDTDVYRVLTWPVRRWFGPFQWTVQIHHVTGWAEHGDLPLLSRLGWFPHQEAAVAWGRKKAEQLYDQGCPECARLAIPPRDFFLTVAGDGR